MANKNPNTKALLNYTRNKTEVTFKKVDNAIINMIRNQEKINFNSVSTNASVSKVFLYKNKQVRTRIETLRKQQEGSINTKYSPKSMNDNSKNVIIVSLKKRISELERENKELKTQLKIQFGKIYENI
jgi:hypothetical protein